MNPEQQQPQPNPQGIQPQPAPETWNIDGYTGGRVLIRIHHFGGVHYSFMDADMAAQLGDQLRAVALQSKTGLIMPPIPIVNAQLLPPPSPNGNH